MQQINPRRRYERVRPLIVAVVVGALLAIIAGCILAQSVQVRAATAAQTPITGPLRIVGKAGQTVTATYKCSVPPAGAMWGVGNDGNGTIANITPDGAGVYTIKLIRERERVWISNPNGQCSSIQVWVIGRARYPRPNIVVIQTRRNGAWTARCHSVHVLKNGTDTIYAAGGCLPPKHVG